MVKRKIMAKVEVIYRNLAGATQRKILNWRNRPATEEALSEWMGDYFYALDHGYNPPGYERPPLPHCARVFHNGRVLAEWFLSPTRSAESPVTAEPLGSGGIPTAVPSAPSSGVGSSGRPPSGAIPQSQRAVNNASLSGDFGVDQGRTVAKAGCPVESRRRESAS